MTLKPASLPTKSTEVYLTHLVSVNEFYVQKRMDHLQLIMLQKKLEKVGKSSSTPTLTDWPKSGDIMAGQFSVDGLWYRCEVLEVLHKENLVKVI